MEKSGWGALNTERIYSLNIEKFISISGAIIIDSQGKLYIDEFLQNENHTKWLLVYLDFLVHFKQL